MDEEEGSDLSLLVNQAPDPGGSGSSNAESATVMKADSTKQHQHNNSISNNNEQTEGALILPPPPRHPYKQQHHQQQNRSLSAKSMSSNASNNTFTTTTTKTKTSWLADTLADIRDNFLVADTVSMDGSRHGSSTREGNARSVITASVPPSPKSISPTTAVLPPPPPPPPPTIYTSSSLLSAPTTEAELAAEWRNKYHQLANKNAELEADLLSQLSALSNALFEKTREHEAFKKASDKTISTLKSQVETQQNTLDTRVKDMESIQLVVEGQKNTLNRLQRQLDTLIADNNYTLEDTTKVEIDRLQAKERENYARLVAFERENKFLVNKLEKKNVEQQELAEELESYKCQMEKLHQTKRDLEETQYKLQKSTTSHAADRALLREEQQKYEDMIRKISLQRKELDLKEESHQQQISFLSSTKSQLESDWMAKCDEIRQRCREELEDMEYQLETKGEELFIAKQMAIEMERKISTLTEQFTTCKNEMTEEMDKQRKLLQIAQEEKEHLLKQLEEQNNKLHSTEIDLSYIQNEKQAAISTLQDKVEALEEEKWLLLKDKDEKQLEINVEVNNLQEEIRFLQEENSIMRHEVETTNVESAKAITDLHGQIHSLEKVQHEKDEKIAESEKALASSQAIIHTLQKDFSNLQSEKEIYTLDMQHRIQLMEQEVMTHKAVAEMASNTLKEQQDIAQDLEVKLDQKTALLMQEISSITSEHKEKTLFYEEEIQQVKLQLEESRRGNNSALETLHHDLRQSDEHLALAKETIMDLEKELLSLQVDHERLRNEKETEAALLVERIAELEKDAAQYKEMTEMHASHANFQDRTELDKALIKELQQKVSSLKLEIESLTFDHENSVQTLTGEVEALTKMLKEAKKENEEIQLVLGKELEDAISSCKDQETIIENLTMDHRSHIKEKELEVTVATERVSVLEKQVVSLQSLLAEAENSSREAIKDLEEKVMLLTSQNTNEGDRYEQEAQKYQQLLEQVERSSAESIENLKLDLQEKTESLSIAMKQIADLEASIVSTLEEYEQLKKESSSILSYAEKRISELEQTVSQYNLQVREIQEDFEAKLTEEADKATVHISTVENEKAYLAALLEEKELCIARADASAEMLRQEIDACHVKLENQSVNERMALSLRLELDAARDELDKEVSKCKSDMEVLQEELKTSKGLHNEERLTFAAALEEKEEALLLAERKIIELTQTVSSISSELSALQNERGEPMANSEDPLKLNQVDDSSLQELNMKLNDRDQTINALLQTAISQDEKLAALEAEKKYLHECMKEQDDSALEEISELQMQLKDRKRAEAVLEDELELLRNEITTLKESNRALSDLQTTLNNMYSAVTELEKEKAGLQDALRQSKVCTDGMVLELESKIQEKEAVVSKLQKSCTDYEEQLALLQTSLATPLASNSLESLQKLHDENEMFACQIIEQEEELEQLKSTLDEKNQNNDSLESEMKELQLKVDLLESTNASLRDYIENQKSKVEVGSGEEMQINMLETQIEDLEISLASLRRENSSLSDQIQKLTEAKVKRDVASVVHGTSDTEKQKLLENLAEKESTICDFIETTKVKDMRIAELEQLLQKINKKQNDHETGTISSPTGSDSKRDLEKEMVQLTQQNQILMAKANQVAELTRKLEESENGRLVFEKTNFESFEKKLAMIKLNKDAALDTLRKEIASLKASKKEIEIDLMNQITALESTRNGNRSESERKMQAKDEVISRLEQQVLTQEQLVGSMRAELEQLRGSMSKATLSRRDEVDEMQEELLDKAAKLKQKERDISALKMKLDEEKLQHADEIAKLRTQLATSGAESATIRGSREIREGQEIVELKETIQQLRRRNTSLSEENSKLCSRIDNLETDKKNIGSSDKWRTSALKDQVKTLMLRVQELEGRHRELRSSATYEWGTGSP